MAPVGDNVCACVCVGFVNRALTACLVKASFNNPHMKQPGWRWIRAGRASLEDRPSLLVNGGCLAYASQSDWAHAQLLAVRLPWPHRALAQTIGRWPQVASGACPGRTGVHPPVSIYAALIGRRPNRYGQAQAQAAPGAVPVSMQATRLGAGPVLRCWAASCMP